MSATPAHRVTKLFTRGYLKGRTHTEETTENVEVGQEYRDKIGGTYIILDKSPILGSA